MKKFLLSAALLMISVPGWAAKEEVKLKPAPEFTATGSDGKQYKLSDFKGKSIVVLEWWNKDCPYVRKHYGSGNMQDLQKSYTGKGVTWLTVLSSAPNSQGYLNATDATRIMKESNASPTTVLLDPKGEIGKLYGAKTTPHMFVINTDGMLVYQGAIDNKPTSDPKDIAGATNYVRLAVDSTIEKKPVETASTKPYGCGVKY